MAAPAPTSDSPPALEFVDVSKSHGAVRALAPLRLRVPRGETVVLIGPSGCGKTTVLRLALGLDPPDTGQVRVAGAALDARNVRALRQRMGYVVQEGGLFPHLTATENVTLMARHLRWPADRIAERLAALAALARLPADALGRYPSQLSGGQRQRVGLMRALMLDPELLLLDEPLGALDPLVRAELQDDLGRVFKQVGKTVVLVTHDLAEAALLADTVVLMREGRVVQAGPIAELVHAPADPFVTAFVAAQRRPLLDGEGAR
ncbi:MAG TPA: ATP-binding cassette domain-containing protein [Polyangia bacterium]|nr:ATP-binding cassette domain-containing protein [Polyangia bacterium]